MREHLHRIFASAITAYVIFALVLIGVITNGQHQQAVINDKVTAQAKRVAEQTATTKSLQKIYNDKICEGANSSWNERNALVRVFTAHAEPPPDQANDPLVVERYVEANLRKDAQRTTLLKLQGPRPTC